MNAYKIAVKLFVENDVFGPTEFVPVFHRWIQEQSLEGHALIDVADYAHVPAGPGTLVVAVEANIHMDRVDKRLGLLYVRKTKIDGSFQGRLRGALENALRAAAKMESEPEFTGRLKFRTDEISIRIHDRLEAPNTPETFAAVKGDVEAVVTDLIGKPVSLTPEPDAHRMFGVTVKTSQSKPLGAIVEGIQKPVGV